MRYIVFLFFFILNLPICFANEQFDDLIEEIIPKSELSNQQLRALRQELKVQKIFLEGIKAIEIQGGEFVNINKASNTIHDLVIKSFGAKSEGLPSAVTKQITETVKETIDQKSIKSVLTKSKDFAFNKLKNQRMMLTSLGRRLGMDVGLVYFLTLQVDVTFPTVMIAMGRVEFAPLLITPVSSTVTGTYAAVKSAVKFRQLIKNLGGLKNAMNIYNLYKEVKNYFNLKIFPQHDLLNINVKNTNYVFTVERKTLFNRIMTKIGLNNNLNYENLSRFLREEDFLTEFLEKLDQSDNPNEVKMIKVLNKIELTQNENVIFKLQERYGKFINELDNIPDFRQARQWVAKISTAKNFDQFNRLILQIPDDIPPKIFDRLWRNHILPSASRNIGPYFDKKTFNAFRKMYTSWDKDLRRIMTESNETLMSDNLKIKLTEYIFNSLEGVNICGGLYQNKGGTQSTFMFSNI
jgi:hypothetical protein